MMHKNIVYEMKLYEVSIKLHSKLTDAFCMNTKRMEKSIGKHLKFIGWAIVGKILRVLIKLVTWWTKKLARHLGKQLNVDVGDL